ncbi:MULTISPECIES: hypothetical protein [unclassified Butyrivibrio]|uniref:hypothetical protein n=1 Tax=unclassified Butyrivibrio TaxID=2639466 RepID=UPI0003B2FA1F|nr:MULTISPECIES: hypothetical protein [unclassified Butyrivibrio]SEK85465.1 hypothetical protein SAMN04487770_103162 [Butyrivibrio sp. ob235]
MSKRNAKNFIFSFCAVVLVLLFFVSAIVIYVDPFFHFHAPLQGFPYIVDNQLSQNPGMAERMDYDSCIIGSSMTVNFHTDDFGELMGLNTLKLSYSGAYPRDDYNILSIVFDKNTPARKKNPVKAVFLGLDIPTMTAATDEIKYELPMYLYDKNPINDVKYLWNKDVILEYILKPIIQKKGTNLSEVYASWWTEDYYNIQYVMHGYEAPEAVIDEMDADLLIPQTKENLETNILPFIKNNPDTVFYIFFPPYSILYWNNVLTENHFEATMKQYEFAANELLKYDNVRLFYFQNMEETVTDLNNYADYTHYNPRINRYMTECFADGTHEVRSIEEFRDELQKMRRIIAEFDFEELLSAEY